MVRHLDPYCFLQKTFLCVFLSLKQRWHIPGEDIFISSRLSLQLVQNWKDRDNCSSSNALMWSIAFSYWEFSVGRGGGGTSFSLNEHFSFLLLMYLYNLFLLAFLLGYVSFSAGFLYCTPNFLHRYFRCFSISVAEFSFFCFLLCFEEGELFEFEAFLFYALKLCLPEWEEWTWSFCFSDWVSFCIICEEA